MSITISNTINAFDNGVLVAEMRQSDGYVNATKMCQAGGKRWNDYFRLSSTTAFIDSLVSTTTIPVVDLIKAEEGGNGERHTWVHRKIAIHCAMWISPRFAVAVTDLVEKYATGQLQPTVEQRVATLQTALVGLGFDVTNPRYARDIQDYTINLIREANQPAIEGPKWRGVVEIAVEMGYRQAANRNVRVSIGHFINRQIKNGVALERRREEREACGVQITPWIYKDCEELRKCIKTYFDAITS